MGLVTCCMVNMTNQSALLKLALLLLLAYGTDARMNIIASKQDVQVGEEIVLLCKAGGEGTITWQKDEEDIDDEEKVSGIDESSSKLSIKKATMNDAGKYSCLCDFDSGHQDKIDIQLYIYEGERVRQLTDNTLRIEKVRREDAGLYECQAYIRGRTINQKLPVSVVVNAPPKVRLREEVKKVMAGSENNVSLLCLVDGLPKPNISDHTSLAL
ncbi:neural cell adhesion molecule 1-like isoform X3 [Seriola dumerili]|uniref:neural cell adhesion molecule 1-like isoform X3 n=1 Tax=Seriola dumerili TaxID=41447 RepID=UPI000BBE09AA|nr:neural cell adhesion molecule 1-like isoform X3 [Seriola dumerili]